MVVTFTELRERRQICWGKDNKFNSVLTRQCCKRSWISAIWFSRKRNEMLYRLKTLYADRAYGF